MNQRGPFPQGVAAPLRLPLIALSLVFASSTALAQKSAVEIQDDIAFAKGLAQDWGFVDLATEVIARIEREGVPAREREKLGVTKCEIFEVAAINERDRLKRNELFDAALESYADFIEENPVSSALPAAERGFVRLSSLFARSLDISLEDAVGEQAEALRERRVEVLTEAVSKTMDLINSLEAIGRKNRSEKQKAEMIALMLDRGRMLLDLGNTQEDGSFSYEQAIQILEEVVFDAGEGTPASLRAFDLIGQVYAGRGDTASARDYFEAVVEMAIPSDPEAWKAMIKDLDLSQSDKEQRWLFVELATEGLVDAYLSMGETERGAKYALHLYNTWKREGFSLSPQLGYPSLLAAARALLNSGGWIGGNPATGNAKWYASEEDAKSAGASKRNRTSCTDLALQIAQQVNKENKGNVLQVRAQKLISTIIDRAGIVVAPSVLYEAAEGDYNEKNNEAALAGFRRVLRALEGGDNASRLEFSPRIYYRMGRTYQRMDRPLEAALAFKEGCTTWLGDPEYDADNANGFYKSMQQVTRISPGDAPLKLLLDKSEQLAATISDQDKDTINYNLARKAERNKDYAKAIQFYEAVEPAGLNYEKALVNIAVCKLKTGQVGEARSLFDTYLETFVPNNDTGESDAKRAKRGDAMAKAEFYRGQILFRQAQKARTRVDVSPADLEAMWQGVLDLVGTYHERYPEQSSYTPITLWSVITAHLAKGDTKSARDLNQHLAASFPDSPYTPKASIDFYKALKELQTAANEAGEVDRGTALLREMAELLEAGNSDAAGSTYSKLRNESLHWFQLGEWAKAEVALVKLRKTFGDATDEDTVKSMQKNVLPDLAHVFLEQHKTTQAHEILVGLMANTEGKPSKRTVLNYCRSVTGWIEGEGTEINIVPGAGETEEEFKQATDTLAAIAKSIEPRWSCEWYGFQFQLAWGFYAWATQDWSPNKDARKRDTAQRTLKVIVGELGQQFRGGDGVEGMGASCDAAGGDLTQAYGNDTLRRRFIWLWSKVK